MDPILHPLALFEQQPQRAGVLSLLQLEGSRKSVKQERDALERQRKTLRRKNAALLKQ
eukprot:COSAG02_NODE_2288_length_9212_cov_11.304071_8_plen_58_part_00